MRDLYRITDRTEPKSAYETLRDLEEELEHPGTNTNTVKLIKDADVELSYLIDKSRY